MPVDMRAVHKEALRRIQKEHDLSPWQLDIVRDIPGYGYKWNKYDNMIIVELGTPASDTAIMTFSKWAAHHAVTLDLEIRTTSTTSTNNTLLIGFTKRENKEVKP